MQVIRQALDILGISASFLCALHCLALPLVVTFGLAGGLPWLQSATLEWSLIGSTFIIAGWSLFGSYNRHRSLHPLTVAGIGFFVIVGGHLLGHTVEHYLAACGGLAVAYAHYLNWQLLNRFQPTTSTSGLAR